MDVVRTKLSVQTGQTIWVGGVVIGLVRSIRLDERGKDAHGAVVIVGKLDDACLLYTSPSPRDRG